MSQPKTFRTRVPPKPDSSKPFLEEVSGVSVNRVGAHKPTNVELLARSESYRRELPDLVEGPIQSLREFLLSEVVPPGLALYNGAEDAREVAASALEADPNLTSLLVSADSYLQFGLKLKTLKKISGLLDLGVQETALLYTRALCAELNLSDLNSLQGLVSQVAGLAKKVDAVEAPTGVKLPERTAPPKTRAAARKPVRPRNVRR